MLMEIWLQILVIGITFGIIEVGLFIWISYVRKKFQWLIISKYDENPILTQEGLDKFIPEGYDPQIGWIRKPNTTREEKGKFGITKWSINEKGSRTNPKFEEKTSNISCYGDSFTFCRQVNDDETWEYYLSELENTNVLNFGVGNYGIDQSFLRLEREFHKNKTDIVILGVVPDTISRIMSSWKHYYEYGNTFAFKPRFILENEELKLIENKINEKSKFNNYEKYLDEIQKTDYFYNEKFKKEIIHFPYIFTILKNLKRNISIMYWVTIIESWKKKDKDISKIKWNPMKIIMDINLKWRLQLYKNKEATTILEKILEKYVAFAKSNNFIPVFVFLPQKDDITFINNEYNFYQEIEKKISLIEGLYVIPVTEQLVLENKIDEIYSDDNEYGGHFSRVGNQNVASIIHEYLTKINNK
jgi:hypothetical protein